MTIQYMDLTVKMHRNFYDASYLGAPRQDHIARVFYDTDWAPTKDRHILIFFSGGSGLNVQTVNSARVLYAISKGAIYVDTMPVTGNYLHGRNRNFPQHRKPGSGYEISGNIDTMLAAMESNDIIKGLTGANTKINMLGHSRGAAVIMDWAIGVDSGNTEYLPKSRTRLNRITINSPMGSGADGWTGSDRAIRPAAFDITAVDKTKIHYTVGAGDITHTTKAQMEMLHALNMASRTNITFEAVGDDTYTHDYPTNIPTGSYKVFLDFGLNFT